MYASAQVHEAGAFHNRDPIHYVEASDTFEVIIQVIKLTTPRLLCYIVQGVKRTANNRFQFHNQIRPPATPSATPAPIAYIPWHPVILGGAAPAVLTRNVAVSDPVIVPVCVHWLSCRP